MSKESDKIAALEAEKETLLASIEQKDKQIAEQNEAIEALNGELSSLSKKKSVKQVIVSHKKKNYRVIFPQFNYNGEVHTAESLEDKPKLVEELVEIGFGGFEEVAE